MMTNQGCQVVDEEWGGVGKSVSGEFGERGAAQCRRVLGVPAKAVKDALRQTLVNGAAMVGDELRL